MSAPSIYWCGQPLPFVAGESVAHALTRAGVTCFGPSPVGVARAVFCGIGQCQMCLVQIDGRTAEACLTLCVEGMQLRPETTGAKNIHPETDTSHD